MNKPVLEDVRILDFFGEKRICLDFSNDRHVTALVENDGGPDDVSKALKSLVIAVVTDPELQAGVGD